MFVDLSSTSCTHQRIIDDVTGLPNSSVCVRFLVHCLHNTGGSSTMYG